MHYIRYDTLYEYVLSRIKYWSLFAREHEDELLAFLTKNKNNGHTASQQKASSDIKKSEKRLKELDLLFERLYEDRLQGKINERNFNMLTIKYQKEQDELQELISVLTAKLKEQKEETNDKAKWIELIKSFTDPQELTADLLNALIEKIVVHEATTAEDGMKEQEVEIYYRFVGKIE